MSNGPAIAAAPPITWENWVGMCVDCLRGALEELRQRDILPARENALNLCLFNAMQRVADAKYLNTNPIRHECPNTPDDEDTEDCERLTPAPDIRWGYRDTRGGLTLDFTIECKRLRNIRKNESRSARDYVRNGIIRFRDRDKGYGHSTSAGAMVAYVQSGELESFLDIINTTVTAEGLTRLVLCPHGWQHYGPSLLKQTVNRDFPNTTYHLDHFWVDLRQQIFQNNDEAAGQENRKRLPSSRNSD